MKYHASNYKNLKHYAKSLFAVVILCAIISCKEKHQKEDKQQVSFSPLSIKGLQKRDYKSTLTFEKKLENTGNFNSELISYLSDSLKVYALVTIPKSEKPKNGYPILIFGHGFHPEPKKYGISTKTGKNWRPGDYYRGIPKAYAKNGYLVVTPDYRGHNISEGFQFTQTSYLASSYYTIDVLNLISTIKEIKNTDVDNIFYIGHSMGGDVGLKTLLATNKIKAASIWSGVSASTYEQALYYGKFYDKEGNKTTPISINTYMEKLNKTIHNLGFKYDINAGDAIHSINEINTPIIIHHARWETSVPYQWSESLAAKLFTYNKVFELHTYNSKNHLFKDENRLKAVERDILFFNKHKSN
ncbi:MAG: alpha/beta hydrolase family protein [Polaribacter sp.]